MLEESVWPPWGRSIGSNEAPVLAKDPWRDWALTLDGCRGKGL